MSMTCPYCSGSGVCDATFGARLRAIRNDKRLTQDDMAKALQISRSQIANLEVGRTNPSMDLFRMVVAKFGVSADWLLGGNEPIGDAI